MNDTHLQLHEKKKKQERDAKSKRPEIPEQYWNYVEILLVGGNEGQMTLKPSGIKKGRKLCIKVPKGLECRDYDVRVVFAGKVLHGAIPLEVRGEDSDSDDSDYATDTDREDEEALENDEEDD